MGRLVTDSAGKARDRDSRRWPRIDLRRSGNIPRTVRPSGDSNDVFGIDPAGDPIRISRRGVHIISAAFDGRVRWRSVVDQPLGPLAAGTSGVAIMLGKSLAWFPTIDRARRPDNSRVLIPR